MAFAGLIGAAMSGAAGAGLDVMKEQADADLMEQKAKRLQERQMELQEQSNVAQDARLTKQLASQDARQKELVESQERRDVARSTAAAAETARKEARDRSEAEARNRQLDLRERQVNGMLAKIASGNASTSNEEKANATAAARLIDMAKEAREQNKPDLADNYLQQANAMLRFGKSGPPTLPARERKAEVKSDVHRSTPAPAARAAAPAKVAEPMLRGLPASKWNDAELSDMVLSNDKVESDAAADEIRRRMLEKEEKDRAYSSGGYAAP